MHQCGRRSHAGRGRDTGAFGTDPAAFEAFYRAHLDMVHGFVARRVPDPWLAADLTADVFVAVIESAHTFREDRGTPTGWLFGIARNVVNSERRRTARASTADRENTGRRLLDSAEICRLEDRIGAEAEARRVYRAMDRLPESERSVLELAALDGLSLSDVAGVLGISAVTARVRLHRARRRIRDLLDRTGHAEKTGGVLGSPLPNTP
ncbi:RNA polymerase sigma factor [Amycolatopsis keratiniphila]|uniref:RNA polymerase sigma factor n=1 Tax=Amycolatopsis keratiniphila TaxID=129921 RepID=UPI00087CA92A|nr:sigma-70 family RNA polymerase sigma factor [Amycolatopsis keratiniphila]SDU38525.1 RNA polymerase sigma-70 factor, ECF subfamily [Amycolatopsis keratiniphila]